MFRQIIFILRLNFELSEFFFPKNGRVDAEKSYNCLSKNKKDRVKILENLNELSIPYFTF